MVVDGLDLFFNDVTEVAPMCVCRALRSLRVLEAQRARQLPRPESSPSATRWATWQWLEYIEYHLSSSRCYPCILQEAIHIF